MFLNLGEILENHETKYTIIEEIPLWFPAHHYLMIKIVKELCVLSLNSQKVKLLSSPISLDYLIYNKKSMDDLIHQRVKTMTN